MKSSISIFYITLLIGLAAAFVNFEYNKEYEFKFKSELDLYPAFLGGRQLVNATILARKLRLGGRSLVVRIKDSSATGANINSNTKSNIEGVFGVNRNYYGEITSIISKSTVAKGVLTKKFIASMLINDFSFVNKYLRSSDKNRKNKRRVPLSIGWCNSDITAMHNPENRLTKISAQAAKTECNVNPFILIGGQLLLFGTTDRIEVRDDSSFGLSVTLNSATGHALQVSRFTYLNLVVSGREVQTRHNVILDYVGEHSVTSETDFGKPHYRFSNNDIDDFFRD